VERTSLKAWESARLLELPRGTSPDGMAGGFGLTRRGVLSPVIGKASHGDVDSCIRAPALV